MWLLVGVMMVIFVRIPWIRVLFFGVSWWCLVLLFLMLIFLDDDYMLFINPLSFFFAVPFFSSHFSYGYQFFAGSVLHCFFGWNGMGSKY